MKQILQGVMVAGVVAASGVGVMAGGQAAPNGAARVHIEAARKAAGTHA